ncbi:hypothetical protein AAG906_038389 [Vitis piasezkii]
MLTVDKATCIVFSTDDLPPRVRAIPSSLHQNVKFIHEGIVITIQSTRDSYSTSSHTVVLDMMRFMSFLLSLGLGRRQHSSREFIAVVDHDTPFGLGFIPTEKVELQRLVHQLWLSDGAPSTSTSALAAPSSPDCMSLMTLYFPDEINEHRTFAEIGDIVDGVVPHDKYIDEMLTMSVSQIDKIVQPELASSFDLFRVSAIEVAEEI